MGNKRKIVIAYKSAPDAGALQWLTPEKRRKKHPFLLSQGQSIENRNIDPDQGFAGSARAGTAHIAVPSDLTAVMSAPKWDVPVRRHRRRT